MNFLPTTNPFALATPPAWFLAALAAYDPALVIFPSTHQPLYRVGRRGRYGTGLLRGLAAAPDSAIYVAHRLWPWKSILPESLGMTWARVLNDLPLFDTQRVDDPGAALDALEAEDAQAIQRAQEDEADQRAAAFYRTLGLVTGSRVGGGRRPEGAGYRKLGPTKPRGRRPRVYRPSGAGTGALFVGR